METVSGYNRGMVSADLQVRTVRFHLFGRRAAFVSRQEFLQALQKKEVEDAIAMWKGESAFEIFVTFKSETSALLVLEDGEFSIKDVSIVPSRESLIMNDVRIHWTPIHIEKDFFDDYFKSKGFKITNFKMEKDNQDGLLNGARLYRLVGPQKHWDDLPHVCYFRDYGFQALFKVTGREPLCLKCKQLGHQRSQCPQTRGGAFVRRQQQQHPDGRGQKPSGPGTSTSIPPRRWEKSQLSTLSTAAAVQDSSVSQDSKKRSVETEEEDDNASLQTVPEEVTAQDVVGEVAAEVEVTESFPLSDEEMAEQSDDEEVTDQPAESQVSSGSSIPCGQVPPPLSQVSASSGPTPTTQELVLGKDESTRFSDLIKASQASPKPKRLKASKKAKVKN